MFLLQACRCAWSSLSLACIVLVLTACGHASSSQEDDRQSAAAAGSSHRRMLELLATIRDRTADEHPLLGDSVARNLRAQLAALPAGAPPATRFEILARLGQAEVQLGHEGEAIQLLEQAHEMLQGLRRAGLKAEIANEVLLRLAMACMRMGETQNCCLRHSADSCTLPIQGEGIHSNPEGSQKAIHYLTEVLQSAPKDSLPYLDALWLLNVAYQTLGTYPAEVPASYLIPPAAFRSSVEFPRFPEISLQLGFDDFHAAGGAIADDFDNDGTLDLMRSSLETDGQIRLWLNPGDGSFREVTEKANLTGLFGGLNIIQADYDNDGDVDVLVLRGGWWGLHGRHPKSLLRNNGDATFTDVAFDAGLVGVQHPTQTASWADYDNDGDLDLYVGHETTPELTAPCQLFRNNGNGTFADVTEAAGVNNLAMAKAVIWGDFDRDRFPDLYVSNRGAPNRLYRNNHDGTFTDLAPQLGVTLPIVSFPAWFWDVNNDGNLDLWVSAYAATIAHVAASNLGQPVPEGTLMKLYLADGRGGFQEVSRAWGLSRATSPMGSNFGDLDGDGWLDFYVGTGDPELKNLMPNLMFLNRGGKGFADVTFAGGFGNLQKGHGVVFADFDNDGDQDIFENMGGVYPVDKYHDLFFENPGFGNHWLTVQLVGVDSNRSAIGARLRAEVIEAGRPRSIYKHVGSGGTFGGNPLRQTLGLGRADRIERLSVFWPKTGKTQVFQGVPLDRSIRIVEGQERYQDLPLGRFKLGAPS